MIYFLQPTDGGPVKIGFTDNLDARHRQLESHYGRSLALLATMDGGREEESGLHERFAHLRFGRTEQFRPGLELLEFIGRPLLVDANPDAVEVMEPTGRKPMVVQIRGSDEYKAWVESVAKRKGFSVSVLFDQALRNFVGDEFGQPPER